ncbi:MAG: thiamine pyrophosphate-binding protein [Dehalococcoidia bacterium]
MAELTGNQILAKALKHEGVSVLFFLAGGPMDTFYYEADKIGIRLIDARHEQGAAMMAHAWSRATGEPGICAACSGPGTTNLVTGIVTAYTDACPVIALGGSSNSRLTGWEDFQEVDQVSIMRPITKWASQCNTAARIPEFVSVAFRKCWGNRPGPVYVDLPGDVLHQRVDESDLVFPVNSRSEARPMGDPEYVKRAIELLAKAERPVVLTGTGVFWSKAWKEMEEFIDTTGIPFYTTPQGRGVVPEDHELSFPAARSLAFREADVALVVGTRLNWIWQYMEAPRFAADLKTIQVNTDREELGHNRAADIGIVGDAKMVFQQLSKEAKDQGFANKKDTPWIDKLQAKEAANMEKGQALLNSDQMPMHPLRMLKEIRDFLPRDAMLVVDGHETLNFARQTIPTYFPGHRINSGSSGCMGVGLPFGIAAALAKPDKKTLVIHGDGSFGINAINLDTAVRHNIPVVTVVNVNGGWAAGRKDQKSPGGDLSFATRYDKLGEALGAHGEYVEKPEEIGPALERAFASGKPAVVNVITDRYARSTTQNFQPYEH